MANPDRRKIRKVRSHVVAVSTKKMAMGKGQSGAAPMVVIARDCYSVAMNSRGEEHQDRTDSESGRVAVWPVRRRLKLPVILFVVTCFSVFLAGACHFAPDHYLVFSNRSLREVLLVGWLDGLVYMVAVIAILLSHEMGHFLTAKAYNIKVLEFGFGFPPRLFYFRRGETLYSLNLLPPAKYLVAQKLEYWE